MLICNNLRAQIKVSLFCCLFVLLFVCRFSYIMIGKWLFFKAYFNRFDWQEKLLEKTVKTDIQMGEYVKQLEKAMESIRGNFSCHQ